MEDKEEMVLIEAPKVIIESIEMIKQIRINVRQYVERTGYRNMYDDFEKEIGDATSSLIEIQCEDLYNKYINLKFKTHRNHENNTDTPNN